MIRAAVFAIAAASGLSLAGASIPASMLASPLAGDWRPLFDGKTTGGWRGFRQARIPAGWTVVDGALTRTGEAGDIITVEEFSNFELEFEWKITPGGNSGIHYRVTEEDVEMWMAAPEYQVIDDTGYPGELAPAQKTGANYALHPPARSAARPAGEWNAARILANGSHVEHWLNGVKIVEYELWSDDWNARVLASKFKDHPRYGLARRGRIGLQDHGDRVAFRNIRIKTLE